MRVVKIKKFKNDIIITFSSRGVFRKLFGLEEKIKHYRGNCTVWYHFPEGKRCSTLTESWLSNIWEKYRWGQYNDLIVEEDNNTPKLSAEDIKREYRAKL